MQCNFREMPKLQVAQKVIRRLWAVLESKSTLLSNTPRLDHLIIEHFYHRTSGDGNIEIRWYLLVYSSDKMWTDVWWRIFHYRKSSRGFTSSVVTCSSRVQSFILYIICLYRFTQIPPLRAWAHTAGKLLYTRLIWFRAVFMNTRSIVLQSVQSIKL